jgi:hypothetical protein
MGSHPSREKNIRDKVAALIANRVEHNVPAEFIDWVVEQLGASVSNKEVNEIFNCHIESKIDMALIKIDMAVHEMHAAAQALISTADAAVVKRARNAVETYCLEIKQHNGLARLTRHEAFTDKHTPVASISVFRDVPAPLIELVSAEYGVALPPPYQE